MVHQPPIDWHRLETALRAIFRDYGYSIDQGAESGDIIAAFALSPQGDGDDLNLTTLAKALAEELAP